MGPQAREAVAFTGSKESGLLIPTLQLVAAVDGFSVERVLIISRWEPVVSAGRSMGFCKVDHLVQECLEHLLARGRGVGFSWRRVLQGFPF